MMMGAASRGLVVLACLALVAGAHATKSKSDAFQKDLEALAEDIHQKYNASFSLAVADLDGNVWPVAKGWAFADRSDSGPMTTESIFPAGSATKPMTSVGILQLVEDGKLTLDTPVHEVLDEWLGERGPLSALIPANDSMINDVVVSELLSMESGLPDYDDENIMDWVFENPDDTFTPFDYLAQANYNGSFLFAPGHDDGKAVYSGSGYILAGFIMAAKQNVTWDKMDQTVIFDRLSDADAAVYSNIEFPMTQRCNEVSKDIVGQYRVSDLFAPDALDPNKVPFMNETFSWDPLLIHDGLNDANCGNGYTMGNVVISPKQAARFWVDVMGGKLLNESSVEKMMNATGEKFYDAGGPHAPPRDQWKAMDMTALGPGVVQDKHARYGMGVTCGNMSFNPNIPLKAQKYTSCGHPGEDWGSAMFPGYIKELGVSTAYGMNVHGDVYNGGQNTSMTWNENNKLSDELFSGLVKVILKHKAPEDDKDGVKDVKRTRSADQ